MKRKNRKNPLKILVMGYLPPPNGGVRVLFRQLIRGLETRPDIRVTVISMTGRRRGLAARSLGLFKAGLRFLIHVTRNDVVTVHPTNTALVVLGPWICMGAKLFGKPVIFRKFGGGFHKTYERWPRWLRELVGRTVLRADLCLFETRDQCRYFSALCRRVEWFPNSRPVRDTEETVGPGPPWRFVYIGHMRRLKGVEAVFRLAPRLPEDFSFHLYGSMGFDIPKNEIARWESESSARYLGELSPEAVLDVLRGYHCLLLPSSPVKGGVTEGHPGVILEALSMGIPVIAGRIGGIGEVVDESCGILVEPGNQEDLVRAARKLVGDEEFYERLSRGARARARRFDAGHWNRVFAEYCLELGRG